MTTPSKAALLALVLALPYDAAACPLCIAAQDESVQVAYIAATAFMTFLPFSLIGGLIYWLRRRARQLALEEEAGVIRLQTSSARTKTAA
jgi:hypothetical protein